MPENKAFHGFCAYGFRLLKSVVALYGPFCLVILHLFNDCSAIVKSYGISVKHSKGEYMFKIMNDKYSRPKLTNKSVNTGIITLTVLF